jgi:hypothetical protein
MKKWLTFGIVAAALSGAFAPQAPASSKTNRRETEAVRTARSEPGASQRTEEVSFGVPACGTETREITGGSRNSKNAIRLSLAMADFTGDSHPDLATVGLQALDASGAQYFIDVKLTEGGRQSLWLRAPRGGLLLTAIDVTGDGSLDLVVRSRASQAIVAVFLNDGCGRFSRSKPDSAARALDKGIPPFEIAAAHLSFSDSAVARSSHDLASLGVSRRQPQAIAARSSFVISTRAIASPFSSVANRAPPVAI